MSARSRNPDTESFGGLNPAAFCFGVFAAPDRRLAFLDHIFWPANGVCRVGRDDLPNYQKIVQHGVNAQNEEYVSCADPVYFRGCDLTDTSHARLAELGRFEQGG